MRLVVWLTLLLPVAWAAGFSYDRCDLASGPSAWGGSCQSAGGTPINLCGAVPFQQTPPIVPSASYGVNRDLSILNNGHAIQVQIEDGAPAPTVQVDNLPQLVGNGVGDTPSTIDWEFAQMHIHTGRFGRTDEGSEHYLQGRPFPLEAHYVHFNPKRGADLGAALASNQPDAVLVIGVFLAVANAESDLMKAMADGTAGAISTAKSLAGNPFRLDEILDFTDHWYAYAGGLTTPNCLKQVTWVVLETPVPVTLDSLNKFKEAPLPNGQRFGTFGTFRPLQERAGRTVFFSGGPSPACNTVTLPNFGCPVEVASVAGIPVDGTAPPGSGAYVAMAPSHLAAHQLAHHAEITLFPPQRWGRVTCSVTDVIDVVPATREENCDKVEIEFVGASAVPPHAAQDFKPWTPFNQYPRATWNELKWRFAGFDSGNLFENTVQVTSSPPCLFTTVVAPGGGKVTMYVQDCALWRGWNDPRGLVTPPVEAGGLGAQTLFDKLVIFLPWPFLAPNAPFPHLMVDTQATFFLAEETGTLPTWTKFGPYRAATPYVIQSPLLALYSLQLLEFLPGAPAQGIRPNTIAGTPLEAVTVTLALGQPLQAGMRIVLATSVGPVDLNNANPTAPPAAFPPVAAAQSGLVWTVPGNEPANTFIPIGPACGVRAGSANCCGQSTAQVLVSQVSQLTYPEWFNTLVITLGPPGCLLPVNRRMMFTIPKAFLGKNPSQTVLDPVQRNVPGFWAIQTLVSTSAEPNLQFLQRNGGDIDPLAYRQGLLGQVVLTAGETLYLEPIMPVGLPATDRMAFRDLAYGGTLSSYVVGLSAFQAVTFRPNTLIAGVQPQEASVAITLTKGLARLVDRNNVALPDVTPYVITMFATMGVLRSNVGSLANPIQLKDVSPAACASALLAMTTATANLLIMIKDDACITALSKDSASLKFVLPGETFLYPNPAAGSVITVDARLVPSQHSVSGQTSGNGPYGAVVQGDSAMLMGVVEYTTTADCSTIPNQVGTVGDIQALTIAARCTLVTAILQISPVSGGFLQCNPGATVQSAQNLVTYVKVPETLFDGAHYPGTHLPPPASAYPQNVALGGTPPIFSITYGFMISYPILAVVVSYPPSVANLQAMGAKPAVPAGYTLAFIVRITRLTTACSTPAEYNPWLFCAVVSAPVAQSLFFPAINPVPAGVPVDATLYGRWNSKAANVACISTPGDGAAAAWYPTGVSPTGDDSDGAWYAFFAFFALPLLLLLCCLCALLYFLKLRKPKSCCPGVADYPVQEMYWVNNQAAPIVSTPALYAPTGSPMYLSPYGV